MEKVENGRRRVYHNFQIRQEGTFPDNCNHHRLANFHVGVMTLVKIVTIKDVDRDIDRAISDFKAFLASCMEYEDDLWENVVVLQVFLMGGDKFCKEKHVYNFMRLFDPELCYWDANYNPKERPNEKNDEDLIRNESDIISNLCIISFVDITTERTSFEPETCSRCPNTSITMRCTRKECYPNVLCDDCGEKHKVQHDAALCLKPPVLPYIHDTSGENYLSTGEALARRIPLRNNCIAIIQWTKQGNEPGATDLESVLSEHGYDMYYRLSFSNLFDAAREKYTDGNMVKIMNYMSMKINNESKTTGAVLVHTLEDQLLIKFTSPKCGF